MEATSDRRVVNINQAMTIAGASRRTIYYWIERGRVETSTKRANGESVWIFEDSLPKKQTWHRRSIAVRRK